MSDPLSDAPGPAASAEIRDSASRLCAILARLFGDDLDRMTLWSRIDTALATATSLVSDDDLDRVVSLCLDHVRADAAAVAACEPLAQLLSTFAVRPPEWRFAFLTHLRSHRYPVLVHGRARWERVKSKESEL